MKRTFCLARATMMLVMMLAATAAWAATSGTIDGCNLTWDYNTTTKTLTIGGSGAMKDLESSSYYTMPWEKDYRTKIEHLVIGKDVTTIGNNSFDSHTNLQDVTFEAGSQLTSIGTSAFNQNKKLVDITLPDGLTSIGDYAFQSATALTSITIPASVTTIGGNAFSNVSLATVTFAEGSQLTTIGNYAFNYTKISSITIPEGVTYLGACAFSHCNNLSSVTLPTSITSINSATFIYCTNLKNITIPSSVTSIGKQAFKESGLTSVTIPANVTNIDNEAFKNCNDLTSVTMRVNDPTTLTIGNDVFSSGVTIHVKSSPNLWKDLFPTLNIDGTISPTQTWESGDTDVKLYDDGTVIVSKKAGDGNGAMDNYNISNDQCGWKNSLTAITSIVIESGVTTIGNNAFSNCSSLSSVTFDGVSTLTSIGGSAFSGCSNLSSVTIPASVTTIGNYVFYNCSNLSSVTLTEGLTTIGENAFYKTGLTSVTIPASVTTIGNYVFYNCSNLSSVTLTKGLTTIGDYAFYKTGLTSVTIPASVTSIGNYVFYNCSNLSSVTLTEGLTTIGYYAFSECSSLSSVTLTEGLTTIGDYAFNKTSLTTVTIPSSVTSIGNGAFTSCNHLTSITIPAGVTSIGHYAFSNCNSLSSVTIPASVTSIGGSAFGGCNSLTSVTIYAPSLTEYGYGAFNDNGSGRKIYVFSDCVNTYKAQASQMDVNENDIEAIPALTVHDAGGEMGSWCTYYNGLADVTVADGTTVYTAKRNNAGGVTLTETGSQIVKRGEAVLLKSNADVVLSSATDSGEGVYTDNELQGVDVQTTQDINTTYYELSKPEGKDFGFYILKEGIDLDANKAYLAVEKEPSSGVSGAPAFYSFDFYFEEEEPTTTAIDHSPLTIDHYDDAWYTMDGRKLNGVPTQRGVYMNNGRKVVIK